MVISSKSQISVFRTNYDFFFGGGRGGGGGNDPVDRNYNLKDSASSHDAYLKRKFQHHT